MEYESHRKISGVTLAWLLAVAVFIAAGLTWRFVFYQPAKTVSKNDCTSQSQSKKNVCTASTKKKSATSSSATSNSTALSKAGSSSSSLSPTSGSTTQPVSQPSSSIVAPTQLTDTGPGDVVKIFIITVMVSSMAAGVYVRLKSTS